MPITPSTWASNIPVTAGQLNQDMYTYDGTYFAAQGVMFHANRPTSHAAYIAASSVTTSPNGQWIQYGGINGEGLSILDSSALFGIGCDSPGDTAKYESAGVTANGSSGIPGVRGGWTLFFHTITTNTFTSTSTAAIGAGWFLGDQQLQDVGCIQPGSATYDNAAIAIDLIEIYTAPTSAGTYYQAAVLGADPSSKKLTVAANTAPNTWGETPRYSQIWCGVYSGGQTVSAVPGTIATFTSTTPITATLLNNSIQQPFNLLNYPPMVNQSNEFGGVVANNTATTLPFSNGTLAFDSYSGFNATTSTYTVKLPGVYFCHANTIFATALTSGACASGFNVTPSGGSQNLIWGGRYGACGGKTNTAASVTRVLDLGAGDTIKAFCWQDSGGSSSLSTNYLSRFVMVWMGALAPPSTNYAGTYTPPDVHGEWFHAGYAPGTGATQLVPLLNAKVQNDINFLINRPYMITYQSTAQTGLSANVWHSVTMNVPGGPIHGNAVYDGDNYNGWSAATNSYVAQVAGWYLCTAEVGLTPNATTAGSIVAGFSNATSGGIANNATISTGATTSTDWYQHMVSVTANGPTAPLACSLYYLLPGESVSPMVMWQPNTGSGTTSTDVTLFNSSFSAIWICE